MRVMMWRKSASTRQDFVMVRRKRFILAHVRRRWFRPNKEHYSLQMEIVLDMARRFNLAVYIIHTAVGDEIWMSRHENIGEIAEMIRWNENSPEWHTIRGSLCGVPPDELDCEFHTKKGWGERTV